MIYLALAGSEVDVDRMVRSALVDTSGAWNTLRVAYIGTRSIASDAYGRTDTEN